MILIDTERLAGALRKHRREQGLNTIGAAAIVGVAAGTYNRMENAVSSPSAATFLRACQWLRRRPEEFVVVDGDRSSVFIDQVTAEGSGA